MIYCISQYNAERIGAALIERQEILEVILRYGTNSSYDAYSIRNDIDKTVRLIGFLKHHLQSGNMYIDLSKDDIEFIINTLDGHLNNNRNNPRFGDMAIKGVLTIISELTQQSKWDVS